LADLGAGSGSLVELVRHHSGHIARMASGPKRQISAAVGYLTSATWLGADTKLARCMISRLFDTAETFTN
jgi:hypothetical protein